MNYASRRDIRRKRPPLYTRGWLWVLVIAIVLVGFVGIVAASALIARDRLEAVVPLTEALRTQITDGDTAAARETALNIESNTREAAAWVQNPAWRASEVIPVLGANFTAVRVAAESAELLASEAIVPASGLDLESLKPVNRDFDIPAIVAMQPILVAANDVVGTARDDVRAIDRGPLIGVVGDAVDELQSTLDDARGLTEVLSAAAQLLPDALGSAEPHRYLMIFQNNAEVRATGGNPAALLLMTASNGEIAIERQASSTDFPARPSPIATVDPETQAIFGDAVGTRLRDSTMTPDFPEAASLVAAWWADRYGQEVDGVLSFDPVALSYLVKASLPVSLPTGEVLDATSTVPLLLSGIYARYPDTADQDAAFAAVSAEIFTTLSSGGSPLTGLLPQLGRAADEGRLLVWSANPDEEELLVGTPVGGTLPGDNIGSTVVGVYLNDASGYKMSYYLDATVEASCPSAGAVGVAMTLVSSAPVDGAGLPDYVVGPDSHGTVLTDVIVYGPVGASLDAVTLDDADVEPTTVGTDAGRPVVRIPVTLAPGQRATVDARFSGATGDLGALEVRTTPMARVTPVAITDDSVCG